MAPDARRKIINKETGKPAQLFPGARAVQISSDPSTWQHANLQLHICPPFESPDLVANQLILGMKLDASPTLVEWHCNGRWSSHTFEQNELFVFPIGEIGPWKAKEPQECLSLSLDHPLMFDTLTALGLSDKIEMQQTLPVKDDLLSGSLLALLSEQRAGCPGGPLYGDLIATSIAAHLLTKYGTKRGLVLSTKGGLSPRSLQVVTNYIHANYDKPISLNELAALTYLSPYHFARVFKHSTGISPYRYLMRYRIERAMALLNKRDVSLKEVAKQVGFYDVSHLTRAFKKILGAGPVDLSITKKASSADEDEED